jgi:hypothetical protein
MNNSEFQAHTERIERSLERVNALGDNSSRGAALELMQSLMDLHGAGLARVVELLSGSGESGRQAVARIADDPLICGLLVLYGVHPLGMEERVQRAIETLQPQLQKLGTTLVLTSADASVIRLKVHKSRPDERSVATIRNTVEQAIREAAPEASEIVIDGMPPAGFVPLDRIQPAMSFDRGEAI